MASSRLNPNPQLGYSIVEIAIVLVALSFMVTGAMWAFSRQTENDRYDSTLEYMQVLEDAVVNYAYIHRTEGNSFTYNLTLTNSYAGSVTTVFRRASVHIGGGRPVLPCPDLNGDGLEDRTGDATHPGVLPGLQPLSIIVTTSLVVAGLSDTYGRCVDDKGFFPYRTLRTKPADPWGNYFTYWVDANNFAHEGFGFDQTTKGNAIFSHLAYSRGDRVGGAIPGADYALSFAYGTNYTGYMVERSSFNHLFGNGYVLARQDDTGYYGTGCSDNCDYALIAGNPLEDVATRTNSSGVDLRKTNFQASLLPVSNRQLFNHLYSGNTFYPMENGIAFAIVSHGPNGHGAAAYFSDHSRRTTFTCNPESEDEGELINARRTVSCPIKAYPTYPTNCSNGTRTGFSNNCQNSNRLRRGNGIFVYGTRSLEFDDIVTWMHPTELITRLTDLGTLPLEPPLIGVVPF